MQQSTPKQAFTIKVGTDIVDIKRITNLLQKHNTTFVNKILTTKEKDYCQTTAGFNSSGVAKRFAGKEAVAKAIGTGFGKNIALHDIEILNNANNKPNVFLTDKVKDFILQNFAINHFEIDISLADDGNFAIAMVVLLGYI